MTARLTSNASLLALGLLLVAATGWFAAATTHWLGFAVATAALAVTATAFAARGRGRVQRVADLATALVAGWTAVATLAFGPRTALWLSFGAGWAFAALGAAGLALCVAALRSRVSGTRR